MSDIIASIFLPEDPFLFITEKRCFPLMIGWQDRDDHSQECAEYAARNHFDADMWEDWFGESEDESVYVQVHEPAINKGIFLVQLERVTEAQAMEVYEDPRVKDKP